MWFFGKVKRLRDHVDSAHYDANLDSDTSPQSLKLLSYLERQLPVGKGWSQEQIRAVGTYLVGVSTRA